jgi:hypothetical protein
MSKASVGLVEQAVKDEQERLSSGFVPPNTCLLPKVLGKTGDAIAGIAGSVAVGSAGRAAGDHGRLVGATIRNLR